MMLAILTTLASLLPNVLLNGWHSYLQATTTREQTQRQMLADTLGSIVSLRQAQAAVIQTGMSHSIFWIPWSIAAITASGWYAWGMIDSTWPGYLPHVAALPPQLLDLTNRIWDNLFLSGSVALGGSALAGAITKALTK